MLTFPGQQRRIGGGSTKRLVHTGLVFAKCTLLTKAACAWCIDEVDPVRPVVLFAMWYDVKAIPKGYCIISHSLGLASGVYLAAACALPHVRLGGQ